MNKYFDENERELVRLVNHFRKRAEKFIDEGRLDSSFQQINEACTNLIEKMEIHAELREQVIQQREALRNVVKDNAECPRCNKNNQLKFHSIEQSEEGWKFNRYRCRKCNIDFTWNRPNNPWDLVGFVKKYLEELEVKIADPQVDQGIKDDLYANLVNMQESIQMMQPVISKSDEDYTEMKERDNQMKLMITEFKKYLLIEKVKMDAWEESQLFQ